MGNYIRKGDDEGKKGRNNEGIISVLISKWEGERGGGEGIR